jgi:hypothetical protein
MNDLLKIEKIREEAASEIIQATSYDHLTEFLWGSKYQIIHKGFATNRSAVLCADAAYYLNLKFIHYGYESYILTVGYQNNDKTEFSHALNLIVLNKNNKKNFIIQDCYLNFGLSQCYFDILKNKNNLDYKIDVNKKKYKKQFLLNNLDNKKLSQYNIKKYNYLSINEPISKFYNNFKSNWNGYICSADFSLDHYLNLYNEQVRENFEYDNFTNSFKKLHNTLNFVGGSGAERDNLLNILYLPFAVCGENAYIDINIINSKKYDEIKNYPETNLLIRILNQIKNLSS